MAIPAALSKVLTPLRSGPQLRFGGNIPSSRAMMLAMSSVSPIRQDCKPSIWVLRIRPYRYTPRKHRIYSSINANVWQWYDLSQKDIRPDPDIALHPSLRNHRFFDSKGPGGATTPRPSTVEENHVKDCLDIDKSHIIHFAHFGYVYCMILTTNDNTDCETLISGGGDGTIKLWSIDSKSNGALANPVSLENGDDSILALALEGTILYSGRLGGEINVWDLDTRQLIQRVKLDDADILTLSVGHGLIFSGGANGIARVSGRHTCGTWEAS